MKWSHTIYEGKRGVKRHRYLSQTHNASVWFQNDLKAAWMIDATATMPMAQGNADSVKQAKEAVIATLVAQRMTS